MSNNTRDKSKRYDTGRRTADNKPIYNWRTDAEPARKNKKPVSHPRNDNDFDSPFTGHSEQVSNWVKSLQNDNKVTRIEADEYGFDIHMKKGKSMRISKDPYSGRYEINEYDGDDHIGGREFDSEEEMMEYANDELDKDDTNSSSYRRRRKRKRDNNISGNSFLYRLVSRLSLLPKMRI